MPSARARSRPTSSTWPAEVLHLAGDKLVLPEDHLVASKPEAGAETKVVAGAAIPDGWFGMDIGPATIAAYTTIIKQAGTVVWNGPMGKFEVEAFAAGTQGDRRSPGRLAGRDGRGRGRIGRGRREIRPGRRGQPRLDRRRRVPRVARGQVVQLAQGHPGQSVKVGQYFGSWGDTDDDLLDFAVHADRNTHERRRGRLDNLVVSRRVPVVARLGK